MLVLETTFQNNISYYFDKEKKSLKSFKGILKGKVPEDITMKQIKEKRLKEKYGYDCK